MNPPVALESCEPASRAALRRARRVCVKAGTSVVANEDGRPSLTRLGAMTEQIADLVQSGIQVILVSSGSVGMGKRLLRKQRNLQMSFRDIHNNEHVNIIGTNNGMMPDDVSLLAKSGVPRTASSSFVSLLDVNERPHTLAEKKKYYDSACAAAGQFEMMNLYCGLFASYDITASQILVTQTDFVDESRQRNLQYSIERLLGLGIVPIINENDAVSANMGYTADDVFSDNDSLAALCARHFGAEVLLLLTDVPGVFDRPPTEPDATLLRLYQSQPVAIGEKSSQGRGGMASKIDAALSAVQPGSTCCACVVAAGNDLNVIRSVLAKTPPTTAVSMKDIKGTMFCTPGSALEAQAAADFVSDTHQDASVAEQTRILATAARTQARKLQALPYGARQTILNAVADALLTHQEALMEANLLDLQAAERDGVSEVLKKRLGLTLEKFDTLAAGIRQISANKDPLGVIHSRRELADNLVLSQVTVPIGVLLIIFESRPDSMPQISALALASGNGLLLKGGKEATHSNAAIHKVIGDAIEESSGGEITRDIIALVTSRGQVADLLSLDDVIDLVIPRGSNDLVSYIKSHTKIPVLGHADGVCHVYVDESAAADAASKLCVDAKTDYPSACNAMETLLLHAATLSNGVAAATLMALRASGVQCLGGPAAMKSGLCDRAAPELKHEYGDLTCLVEVVPDLEAAIDWIHKYGSGHTEAIVCGEESDVGEEFLRKVDAACVFRNASTRFADGFRFGLGAEVGISTGRIHARGPVGVEGLLTTKWQLRSEKGIHYVAQFAGENAQKNYTHRELM